VITASGFRLPALGFRLAASVGPGLASSDCISREPEAGSRKPLSKPVLVCESDQFRAAVDVQLLVDVVQMDLHCAFCNTQV
jgi:hypothetical protein